MEDVPTTNPMIYLPYFMTDPLVIKHGTGMFPKNCHLKWDNHRTKWGNSPANHGTDAHIGYILLYIPTTPNVVLYQTNVVIKSFLPNYKKFVAKQMWFFIN